MESRRRYVCSSTLSETDIRKMNGKVEGAGRKNVCVCVCNIIKERERKEKKRRRRVGNQKQRREERW